LNGGGGREEVIQFGEREKEGEIEEGEVGGGRDER
jgi:hypothetical protein